MKKLSISLNQNIFSVKRDLRRLFSFAMLFGVVKMSAFAAALWMSNLIVDISHYGLFEYALSVGIIMAIPLNVGLQGAYPYFNLKLGKEGFRSVFYFHSLWIITLFAGLIVLDVYTIQFIPPKLHLAFLIGGIISMQVMLSTILKSHEIIMKATVIDGGLFLVINFYNAYLQFSDELFRFNIFQNILIGYAIALYGVFIYKFIKHRADFQWARYKEAINYGRHLVLSAFLIICLTGSARIFIEQFLDIKEVGYYGFYFRFAAVTVMLHQIVNVVFFKRMYQAAPATLDKFFAVFLGGITVIGLMMWWIIPQIFENMLTILKESYAIYEMLYFILGFQMIFWICLALNENIIYREGLSSKMNKHFLVILELMSAAIFLTWWLGYLNIFILTIINMAFIFVATESQFHILKKYKGIDFKYTRRLMQGVFVFFGIVYLLF